MRELTIFAFLAVVVAMASADPESKTNVRNIVEIMERLKNNWKNRNTLPDNENLMNKQVIINGKEVNVGRIIKLLRRISDVNWKMIGVLLDKNKLTLNTKVNVNGNKVEANLAQILILLEGISEIDWDLIDPTSASPKKLSASTAMRGAPEVTVNGRTVDMVKIGEKLERIGRINWSKFDEKFGNK